MPEGTVDRIRDRLAVLAPIEVAIDDESALHAGHPGAASGAGHYRLRVISARFSGESRMARHRLVYDALADLMQREIHALAMTLLAPGEAERPAARPEHPSGH
jgi:BolA protein